MTVRGKMEALVDRGERRSHQEWLSNLLGRERGRMLVAAAIVLFGFVLVLLLLPVTYQVGDDAYYRSVTAGYVSGTPDGHTVFTGFALATLISWLYAAVPSIAWYDVASCAILLVSSWAITKTILKFAVRHFSRPISSALLATLFFAALLVYPIAVMNFSTTSMIAGAGATAVIAEISSNKDSNRVVIFDAALILALAALSYEWRTLMFEMSLCFMAVVTCGRLIKASGRTKRVLILTVLAAAVLIAPLNLLDRAAYSDQGWQNYISYNKARAKFMDYGHESWLSGQDSYQAEGWTRNLLKLVENKFLMDEDITEESFLNLSKDKSTIIEGLRYWWRFLKSRSHVQCYVMSGLLMAAAISCVQITSPKKSIEEMRSFWTTVFVCLGTIAVILYCCWQGNFYYRHFVGLMVFPFFFMTRALVIGGSSANRTSRRAKHFASRRLLGRPALSIMAASLLLPAMICGVVLSDAARTAIVTQRRMTYDTLLAYTMQHKDSIFIGSIYPNFDAFSVRDIQSESNYFYWGHFQSMMYSPLYMDKLENLKIDGPMYADAFLDDNVYYVGTDQELAELLLNYLEEELEMDLSWRTVDSLEAYSVETGGSQYVEESFNLRAYHIEPEVIRTDIHILKLEVESAADSEGVK